MPAGAAIRLMIVDDHALFRNALKQALEADGAMHVVAEASTFQEALEVCIHGPECDLALIDYDLAEGGDGRSGLQVLRALRENRPGACAVVVTAGLQREAIEEVSVGMRASVFLKTEPFADLLQVIQRAMNGEVSLSPAMHLELALLEEADPLRTVAFSQREMLVLRWITEGLANKEIAARADVSEANVKAIIQRLFYKTGVRSRSQLVRYVFEFNVEMV